MHQFGQNTEASVMSALKRYSEYQVARMFGLRVASVRLIRQKYEERQRNEDSYLRQQELYHDINSGITATGRKQETPIQMGLRLHEDLFANDLQQVRGIWKGKYPQVQNLPKLDYAGLEAHVVAGFFTPNGVPTPAFWGFISQYVKKSGHTMLDILHDQEIYSPEQLKRALDIDSQLADMNQVELVALLRRISTMVYANAIQDPTSPGADVSDGQ